MNCGLCGAEIKDSPFYLLGAHYGICPRCKREILVSSHLGVGGDSASSTRQPSTKEEVVEEWR